MNDSNENNKAVPPDPLIDEIREIRRELSERFGNDVYRLGRYLQEREQQDAENLVTQPVSDRSNGRKTG